MRCLATVAMSLGLAVLNVSATTPRGELPEWTLAVNEGATYSSVESPRQSFRAIADGIGRVTASRIRLEAVTDYAVLEQALRERRIDIALVHPAHLSATAVAQSGYAVVAVSAAHAAYRPYFMCRATINGDSVGDIVRAHQAPGAKPIGLPAQSSITSVMARANIGEVIDAGPVLRTPTYKYTRHQDAMVSMIEYGFVDCSVTGARPIADAWAAAGGKVVAGPRTAPVKVILVNPRKVSADAQAALRSYVVTLSHTMEGRAQLDRIGLPQGFVTLDNAALIDATRWLQPGVQNSSTRQ